MAVTLSDANSSNRQSNVRDSDKDLIGIAFPFQRANGQFPKRLLNADLVSNDVLTLWKTPARSRVMRPLVGVAFEQMVFDSTGPLLVARITRAVKQAVFLQAPRVKVVDVVVTETSTLVDVLIAYEVQGVKLTQSFQLSKSGAA